MQQILSLIYDYQIQVAKAVNALQTEFGTESLITYYLQCKIPKDGFLQSGIEYSFHGVGCLAIIEGLEVDFDFGPNNRYDGFDLWRLGLFISERTNKYKNYINDNNKLKHDFDLLIRLGIIFNPGWFPGDSLYYFTNQHDYPRNEN